MDRILNSELLHLPVKTQNDELIGRLVDFELDTTQLRVQQLHVKPQGLFQSPYIISAEHIIEVREDAIIIDEARQKTGSPLEASAAVFKGQDSTSPALNSDNS